MENTNRPTRAAPSADQNLPRHNYATSRPYIERPTSLMSSHAPQRSTHSTNSLNPHSANTPAYSHHPNSASSQKSRSRTIRNSIRSIKTNVRVSTRFVSRLPIPWRSLGLLFGTFTALFALLFHFYFANTARIVTLLDDSRVAADLLEEELLIVSSNLQFVQPLKTVPNEVIASLQNLENSASENSLRFPPQFITSYALRSVNDIDNQVAILYRDNNDLTDTISTMSSAVSALLLSTSDLFTKDITTDTQSYITYLRQSIDRIEEYRESTPELDLTTYLKIYQQILASAEQYQINKDINNFNFQINNVSSELYKTLSLSWDTTMQKVYEDISAKRSSLESIVNSYGN